MLKLALIGCGGMGRRHVRGLHRLSTVNQQRFELVAVCDVMSANADLAADTAAELLGTRPAIFSSLDEMHSALPDLKGVIITTAPDTHSSIGVEVLERGINVLVEKPIALTVSQGIKLVEAAERTGMVLAVAENYRRDPVNRLAKAIVDAGLLGTIYLMVQSSSGAGEKVIITPWRHRKQSGGIVVDMGIHYSDLLEFFLGPIETVFGMSDIVDKLRVDANGDWHDVDAEDLSVGVARFASGAIANWLVDLGGRGQGHFSRMIYGTGGTLSIPQDRSGKQLELTLRRNGSDEKIDQSELLALVPDYQLDDVTAALFGAKKPTSYDLPYADIDANLLAIEQADFADAVRAGRAPEVNGAFGLRSLAIAYGFIEAELVGRAVSVAALLKNENSPYQSAIDASIADS